MDQEIMALCRAMGAAEGREELLLPLARAVRRQLAGRLREGVTQEDCGPAFPLAAAMTVMEKIEEMTGESELSSVSAGELTIKKEGRAAGKTGPSLSQQAEQLLAPWLGDTGFAFQEVQG